MQKSVELGVLLEILANSLARAPLVVLEIGGARGGTAWAFGTCIDPLHGRVMKKQ
jgi:hypothetical protein